MGTVVVSLSNGRNTAIVAVPAMDGISVTGVLGASIYLDILTLDLRSEVLDPFVFYAIDTEGKFAFHLDNGQISRNIATIGNSTSFGQALDRIRFGEQGEVEYTDGGMKYRARFCTSRLTGWRFVIAWPE